MSSGRLALLAEILASNVRAPRLPYRASIVATYRCNLRCEMCGIWQRRGRDEMTAEEVAEFFRRSPGFRWVNLSGGEIFMRPDIAEIVRAIQENCRSLFLLNFPTSGWFGDRAVALVDQVLHRGIGRLMVTVSLDGPKDVHERIRGVAGSWDRAVDTYRRLRSMRRPNFQPLVGMTLVANNIDRVDESLDAIREAIPGFDRSELHLNVSHQSSHYFDNAGYEGQAPSVDVLSEIRRHRLAVGRSRHAVAFLEDRYQAGVEGYLDTRRSPLPCAALAANCFIDPQWNLFPCSIWNERIGNLRDVGFDVRLLWSSRRARLLREEIVCGRCPHCWTPCEAYATILSNLVPAVFRSAARALPDMPASSS